MNLTETIYYYVSIEIFTTTTLVNKIKHNIRDYFK